MPLGLRLHDDMHWRSAPLGPAALLALALVLGDVFAAPEAGPPARGAPVGRSTVFDDFTTTPFAPHRPRWCERYHHGHWDAGAIRFFPSTTSGCAVGDADAHLSCHEKGCVPCASGTGSPCAKAGDPRGNAVIQTTSDQLGSRRTVTATFVIDRSLPVGGSHIGLYAAFHPHCHGTLQAILVPDRPGEYHLNVAAFNQYIGGDPDVYRCCLTHPFASISPPLATGIALNEGKVYRWILRARLRPADRIVTFSEVRNEAGAILAQARYVVAGRGLASWFGVDDGATRFAFGAQFSRAPSPSGGHPSVRLLEIRAIAG